MMVYGLLFAGLMFCSFSVSSLALKNVWGSIVTGSKSFWVLICLGTEVASKNVFLGIKP